LPDPTMVEVLIRLGSDAGIHRATWNSEGTTVLKYP
jgi:hypothetical protein